VALFEDVMGIASGWPRQNPAYFDSHRIGSGGFGAKLYEALGIADAGPVPPRSNHILPPVCSAPSSGQA
jgi:hypothetical protein